MKRRINKKRVVLVGLLLICTGIIAGDILTLFIVPITAGHGIGFTELGLIEFIASFITGLGILGELGL